MKTLKAETKIDYAALKAGGVIMQKDGGFFTLRLRLPGGRISASQLPTLSRIASKYGMGEIHLTTRQGVEIPWIKFEKIEEARKDLASAGLFLGACGPRFRVVTACPGSVVCKHGLVDGQSFGKKIDDRFGGTVLPHKFKAAVSGCPNACTKPLENDIGFIGMVQLELNTKDCTGCGLCVNICKEQALSLKNGKPVIDANRCARCGDCVQSCPSNSWKISRTDYSVFVGGKMGRHPQLGQKIADHVDEEHGLEIISRSLNFYKLHGNKRERFGDMLHRIGLERFRTEVLLHEDTSCSGCNLQKMTQSDSIRPPSSSESENSV
jgi:dissimilatory sulfite reductase (desulfoviridin) alpha/beta subunit